MTSRASLLAGVAVTAAVLEEPQVWSLRESSGLHAGLLNDVFSSSKELDTDPFNLVRVYRVHEGLSESAALLKAVEPWLDGTQYLNFVEAPIDASTGFSWAAWERLKEIRATVDPDHVFLANHEVK